MECSVHILSVRQAIMFQGKPWKIIAPLQIGLGVKVPLRRTFKGTLSLYYTAISLTYGKALLYLYCIKVAFRFDIAWTKE